VGEGGLGVDDLTDRGSGRCSLEQQRRQRNQSKPAILAGTEQSLNNSLPNTTHVLTRATGTKEGGSFESSRPDHFLRV